MSGGVVPKGLLGFAHRTVYIEGCPQGYHDDLAAMMQRKCGALEAFESDETRLTLVFATVDAATMSTSFTGMTYPDMQHKLTVWISNKPKPQSVLAIEAKKQGAADAPEVTADTRSPEEIARENQRKAERKAMLAELFAAAEAATTESVNNGSATRAGADSLKPITDAERDQFMLEHAERQVRALIELTRHVRDQRVREAKSLEAIVNAARPPTTA